MTLKLAFDSSLRQLRDHNSITGILFYPVVEDVSTFLYLWKHFWRSFILKCRIRIVWNSVPRNLWWSNITLKWNHWVIIGNFPKIWDMNVTNMFSSFPELLVKVFFHFGKNIFIVPINLSRRSSQLLNEINSRGILWLCGRAAHLP